MRYILAIFLLTLSFRSAIAVQKGDIVLQPALNLGAYGPFDRYSNGSWGGVILNADFAVIDYLSIGPYIGFNSGNGYTSFGVGARGSFHWWQLIADRRNNNRLRPDQIDFYLPFFLGFRGVNSKEGVATDNDFFPGIGIGFRYYFNDNIGLGFEFGGMEMSSAKLGVAIKL
jgi:hypothetical protein